MLSLKGENEGRSSQFTSDDRVAVNLPELHGNGGELQCPICKGIIVDARMSAFCLHRYCRKCIEKWITMQGGQKTCPMCKASLASKRDLKKDKQFDEIVTALCGNAADYKAKIDNDVALATEKYLKEHRPVTPSLPSPTPRSNSLSGRKRPQSAIRGQCRVLPATRLVMDEVRPNKRVITTSGYINYISPQTSNSQVQWIPPVIATEVQFNRSVRPKRKEAPVTKTEVVENPPIAVNEKPKTPGKDVKKSLNKSVTRENGQKQETTEGGESSAAPDVPLVKVKLKPGVGSPKLELPFLLFPPKFTVAEVTKWLHSRFKRSEGSPYITACGGGKELDLSTMIKDLEMQSENTHPPELMLEYNLR